LRILQLVSRRQNRGAEISASILSHKLIERGHFVIWAGLYRPYDDLINISGAKNIDFDAPEKSFINFEIVKSIKNLIIENNIEVVQANGSDTLKYAYFACPRNVRLVYRNISLISYWIGKNKFKKIFYRFLASRLDAVLSVSTQSANDFGKVLNFPISKIKVISRGIPFVHFDKNELNDQIKKTYGIPRDHKIILWAGSISEEKNPFLAIDIFRKIKEEYANVSLIFIGKGVLFDILKSKCGSEKDIYIIGFRSDILKYLAAADILLLTSKVEGVPGVVLEAASQKTVSVASNVGGVSEAIIDRETGILVNKNDIENFVSNVKNLLLNDLMRDKMGENAYLYIKQKFDLEKSVSEFENIYSD
jgi:glycosyltransferase involved in cell wall biosynthesis